MISTSIDTTVTVNLTGRADVYASRDYAHVKFHAGSSEVALAADPDTLAEVLEEAAAKVRRLAGARVPA